MPEGVLRSVVEVELEDTRGQVGPSKAVTIYAVTMDLASYGRKDAADRDYLSRWFLDTVNVPGGPLTGLWAPVGLRYHALHHYLPDMPYHALGRTHARLMASLPEDAPYRQVNEPSLLRALARLWGGASPEKG